jgi:hypothetical protein
MGRDRSGVDTGQVRRPLQQCEGDERHAGTEQRTDHQSGDERPTDPRRGDTDAAFEADGQHQIERHRFGDRLWDSEVGAREGRDHTEGEEEHHRRDEIGRCEGENGIHVMLSAPRRSPPATIEAHLCERLT